MNKNKNASTEAKAQNKKSHASIVTPNRTNTLKEYRLNLHKTDFAYRKVASRRDVRRALLKAGYSIQEAEAMLYRMGYRTGGNR